MTEPKRKMVVIMLILPLILTASCSSLHRPRYQIVSSPAPKLDIQSKPLILESLAVRQSEVAPSYSIPAREIIETACRRYQITLTEEGDRRFSLSLWITEERTDKNLEVRYTVNGVLRVRDRRTGSPIFHLLYSEESDRTIRSPYRLFEVADRIFARMSLELNKKEEDES